MELGILKIDGTKASGKVKLDETIFGVEPNDHAIYLDVKQYLANQRQGTHKSKERSEIKGSTRKLRKQKGTGNARVGNIKNPLFKGGGRVFGPRVADHSFKLNKKLKRVARKSALSYKAKDQQIFILEDFKMETPKTSQFVAMLKNLKSEKLKTLFVVHENDENTLRSSRNIPHALVRNASNLNTFDIMNCNHLIFTQSAVKMIEENLKA